MFVKRLIRLAITFIINIPLYYACSQSVFQGMYTPILQGHNSRREVM